MYAGAYSHAYLTRICLVGCVGGVAAVAVGYPFDTVKVRMQTGRTDKIFRHLWRGIAAPLTTTPAFWSAYYFGYIHA